MPGRLFLNSILGLFLISILVFKGVIYHLVKYLRVDIEIKKMEWNTMEWGHRLLDLIMSDIISWSLICINLNFGNSYKESSLSISIYMN